MSIRLKNLFEGPSAIFDMFNHFSSQVIGMACEPLHCERPLAKRDPFSAWWYCETLATTLLAFNRCVDVISPSWADKLFGGWKTWPWLTLPTLFGLEHMFSAPVVVYSCVLGWWHYNQHVEYLEDKQGIVSSVRVKQIIIWCYLNNVQIKQINYLFGYLFK